MTDRTDWPNWVPAGDDVIGWGMDVTLGGVKRSVQVRVRPPCSRCNCVEWEWMDLDEYVKP